MKLAVSFSCGKDSTLALYKAMQSPNEVKALITTINKDSRSWFHGVNDELLHEISNSLGIPLYKCITDGSDYEKAFEDTLEQIKKDHGIEGCVFGDIDIELHRKWTEDRCKNVGIEAVLPLWQADRRECVDEFLNLGFKAVIKCVQLNKLPNDILGKVLNSELVDFFVKIGVDACGENGEYHTVVVGGDKLFKKEIPYKIGEYNEYGRGDEYGRVGVVDITL